MKSLAEDLQKDSEKQEYTAAQTLQKVEKKVE